MTTPLRSGIKLVLTDNGRVYTNDENNTPVGEIKVYDYDDYDYGLPQARVKFSIPSNVLVKTMQKNMFSSVTLAFPEIGTNPVFIDDDKLFIPDNYADIQTVGKRKIKNRNSADLCLEEIVRFGIFDQEMTFTMTTRIPAFVDYMYNAEADLKRMASYASQVESYDSGRILRDLSYLTSRLLEFDRQVKEFSSIRDDNELITEIKIKSAYDYSEHCISVSVSEGRK